VSKQKKCPAQLLRFVQNMGTKVDLANIQENFVSLAEKRVNWLKSEPKLTVCQITV